MTLGTATARGTRAHGRGYPGALNSRQLPSQVAGLPQITQPRCRDVEPIVWLVNVDVVPCICQDRDVPSRVSTGCGVHEADGYVVVLRVSSTKKLLRRRACPRPCRQTIPGPATRPT